MDKVNRIAILLAGYRGHEFFYEQIASLLDQYAVTVDVFIRVDGVCKRFDKRLESVSKSYSNVTILRGDSTPTSSGENFYKLFDWFIANVRGDYDYIALCDQDDIWKRDKLQRAITVMSESHAEGYSSGFIAFDQHGNRKNFCLGEQTSSDHLFQAGGPGCSIVLSARAFRAFWKTFSEDRYLAKMLAHDWAIYFCVRILGFKWAMDPQQTLYYRQHGGNVAGVNSGMIAKIKRVNVLFNGWYRSDLQQISLYLRGRGIKIQLKDLMSFRRKKVESILISIFFVFFIRPWMRRFNG